LLRESFVEQWVHGKDGIGGALRDMPVHKQASAGYAPDFIVDETRRHPGEVTLVMTAPLTNLALAVRKAPELVHLVKEVIVMGGVVSSYGNVTPTAEYNIYVDPEAAKIVFHAGFPLLTLVGLDVTRKALLTEEHIRSLGDSAIAHYVKESTADYMQRYYERNGVRACALHDPLAVGVALSRDLVTTRPYYVDVETRSELCDGQTVCDFQNRLAKQANMHICVDVDADTFLRMFTQTLRA
jgi:purine nucleosidase